MYLATIDLPWVLFSSLKGDTMIIKQYIKDFEELGFGLFVHFGLYSLIGKGEWSKRNFGISDEEYQRVFDRFCPGRDWAVDLVRAAKKAGCRYITLTTKHHEGFCLYDTQGLNDFDAPHACGRDLVREFVDACRKEGIKPFFYHALLDWHPKSYNENFPEYLQYLRRNVELLCRNYGEIGGFWFDGQWDKWDADWEEDALYATIRKYQPCAMIINNTGTQKLGQFGHAEIDSVTFERGKPFPIDLTKAPKYLASEMCEVLNDHWGYARRDLNYRSPAEMICTLCECRRAGSNMLLNVGPMGDGSLRTIDQGVLEIIGQWMELNGEAIYLPRPTDIKVENKEKDFILKNDNTYYLFCHDLPMVSDEHVAIFGKANYISKFEFPRRIESIRWLDDGTAVEFEQSGETVVVKLVPFAYGQNLVIRVAKIVCRED